MWYLEGYDRITGFLTLDLPVPTLDVEALVAILGNPAELFGAEWPVTHQVREILRSHVEESELEHDLDYFIVFLRS